MPACPSCGQETPEGFPRCANCGAPLAEAPAASVQEERKVVSVLFCDLVGFTAASDAADPEDVRARIRPYHARLRQEIERYGGTVEKFVGDAVMAVFGAPVAHEDDAERAVRAGLRILEAIAELNEADPALSLQVRIGINTGEAVVALGARPEQGEGIVTGDVVNTASRLQGAAPVDGIAVSEHTYRQTERIFDYEPLQPVGVKGKAEPLSLFRPLRARARFGTDLTRTHASPLVGRELERQLLLGTFERSAQQRSLQLVTIVGEPGVGKSRLCAELFAHIEERPELVTWRQGRCLPYGEGIAFWALGEVVKAECGILESDSPGEARAKLERAHPRERAGPAVAAGAARAAGRGERGAGRAGGVVHGLAALLPVAGGGGAGGARVRGSALGRRRVARLPRAPGRLVGGVPLAASCARRGRSCRSTIATWAAGLRNATTINLAPLTDEETARLIGVAHAAGGAARRRRSRRCWSGRGATRCTPRSSCGCSPTAGSWRAEVPGSVQALIAARLDTLTAGAEEPAPGRLRGRQGVLGGRAAAMGDRDPREVEQALHELARKELVRPARSESMAGEAEYGFWHALVRDVCYAQIPRAARAAPPPSARPPGSSGRQASGARTWPTCSPTTTCRRSSSPAPPGTSDTGRARGAGGPIPLAGR